MNYDAYYTLRSVQYSYNYLSELMHNTLRDYRAQGITRARGWVDIENNCARAVIKTSQAEALGLTELTAQSNEPVIITFEELEEPALSEPACTVADFFSSPLDLIPIVGGMWINNASNRFSAGYMGTDTAGDQYLITCGHGNALSVPIYAGQTSTNQKIGTTYQVHVGTSQSGTIYGDYAFVELNGTAMLTKSVYFNYQTPMTSVPISGIVPNPSRGTIIYQHGAATGSTSKYRVEQTNVEENFSNYVINGLSICSLVDGPSDLSGNSGAPYFIKVGNKYYICGIHSFHFDTSVGFTPWHYIQSQASWFSPSLSA